MVAPPGRPARPAPFWSESWPVDLRPIALQNHQADGLSGPPWIVPEEPRADRITDANRPVGTGRSRRAPLFMNLSHRFLPPDAAGGRPYHADEGRSRRSRVIGRPWQRENGHVAGGK